MPRTFSCTIVPLLFAAAFGLFPVLLAGCGDSGDEPTMNQFDPDAPGMAELEAASGTLDEEN